MILLDTNVLSAMMRPELNPAVVAWLNAQNRIELRMTSVALHELQFGLELLPLGKWRQELVARLDVLRHGPLGKTVLGLDTQSGQRAAIARAAAERATGCCDVPDALTAGIAVAHGASIATRNIKDFIHFGVPLINPWT